MTFSGVLVIGNHQENFEKKNFEKKKKKKKNLKKKKKKSHFSKIEILLCNSYSRITKMLKILKNLNFLPKKRDKTADCKK